MLRLILQFYLMLATAVGPGFCAFPQKLVHVLSGSTRNEQTTHRCCPNNGAGENTPINESPKTPCQCKEPRVAPISTKTAGINVYEEFRIAAEIGFGEHLTVVALPESTAKEIESPRNLAFS